ncbi:hypothetical protein AB670_00069 [Chryseobacterium sp. MOF25P]|uniref:hypothetical protein n=1 Tax=unclassified Chryseobacterium TaxID=2593645 RepID=UPI000804B2FB|nr:MULTISPECIES: hypothetical protein [unclassified Chryseobacterium]OBW43539.1 hypothetical protein AB670_00069 [Chryseobacterium sp. MOF25P]OBW46687.1 hypothetical protein AB671_01182 [Chryseobacterium sp. BGARF1]
MKTKVLFIGAICALSVISCSPDREEQLNENPESARKLDVKKLKINNRDQGQENKIESDTIKGFTPYASPLNSTNPDFGTDPEPDPNEGGDPKNLPPRK